MASHSSNPRWDLRPKNAGVSLHIDEENFETRKVDFQGHMIEVAIPTGALADYMFERGKAARA